MWGNYDRAFELVIGAEGGYVNDPADPGGETKFGISKRAYPKLDIKNLTLEQAKVIYLMDYWRPVGCDKLPYPLDMYAFDCAVNQGVSRAITFLKVTNDPNKYLMERLCHYKGLHKERFFKGWVNRIITLYEETSHV